MSDKPETLSLEQVRLLTLKSQGLLKNDFGKGKNGTLSTIEHLGYVQIDTLAVVSRAHHHTLYNRLPDYNEQFLNDLLEKDKKIFEYWSHAASYLPMIDYRFSLPRKRAYAEGKSHWFPQDKQIKKYVLDRIKAEGPLQSKDFEHKRTGPGNWYEWKPAKRALEQLFMEGQLMVARRQGFQKVYDLTERILPKDVNVKMPSEKEVAEHLIRQAVNANGIVDEKEIAYLRSGLKEHINETLNRLLKSGEFVEVKVENCGTNNFVTTNSQLEAIDTIKKSNTIHFLSPFDNVVIQRKRLLRFFNFDYQVECYLPEAKRKYGYFCLPVLYGNKFVARFDPKADRATKTFYIKSIYFENGFMPDEKFNLTFAKELKHFANFTGCDQLIIDKADLKWKKEMNKILKDQVI